jgi:hypothetical protein
MTWTNLKNFHFWCQKVLPLVYDDSLSYYETLCKIVDTLNKVIDKTNELGEMFAPLVSTLAELKEKFEKLEKTTNASLLALNERCTALEDADEKNFEALKAMIESINEGMTQSLEELRAQYNMLSGLTQSIITEMRSGDALALTRSKEYTDKVALDMKKWITNPRLWFVVSPISGQVVDIQTAIDELYGLMNWGGITAGEFDAREFTCDYLDGIGYSCYDFDFFGRFVLLFSGDYVTQDDIAEMVKQSQLEYYALKTDLEPYALKKDLVVYNPVTGFKNTIQQVIDTLISFHQCGNNCFTLDGMDLTASQYDAIGYTAFQFDFKGLIEKCGKYINPITGELDKLQDILNMIVGQLQNGLTATQFDSMSADCDTLDGLEYTAYEFDFLGLNFFSSENMIGVLTGLTADDWNNLFVGQNNVVFKL